MVKQKRQVGGEVTANPDQLAVFNETFASFNNTIRVLNESYASLQLRYQKLSDELVATNEKLLTSLEQNLQTTNFLQNVLASLTAGVITIDLSGRINSINKAGCTILRATPEEIIGKDYQSLFHRTFAGSHSLSGLLKGEESYRNVEKNVCADEETTIPISVSGARITDGNGEAVGALEVFVDLTEMKRMEEEIARVKSLAALGEVAAVIAHEVRNPLSGIAGFAALLKKELGSDHPNLSYVDKIIAGVEKLNRSVTSLLEYARDLRYDPRVENLNAVLQETVEFFNMDLSTRRSRSLTELRLPAEPIVCKFDRENLSGALVNLLKNADEAMPSGGMIKVEAVFESGVARLSVSDQGGSVPEEIRDKIFTPFFTTREGGTGLGLALVKKVVDAHRGRIEVTNNAKAGSTFTITLPFAP
jgi:PAS domain S-box-containing protein